MPSSIEKRESQEQPERAPKGPRNSKKTNQRMLVTPERKALTREERKAEEERWASLNGPVEVRKREE